MFEKISSLVPVRIVESFKMQLIYNHIDIDERKFTGMVLFYALIISAVVAVNVHGFLEIHGAIIFPIVYILAVGLTFAFLRIQSDSKGKFVETILPDVLQIIASNMKSGMTTERALFVASRPEFGILEIELKNASKRITSGERVDIALTGIGDRINSITLQKTLWLIAQGISSGGEMANLLFRLSDDLKSQNALKDQISADISIYVLLIFFASALGAPMLFGVSSFIVEVLSNQLANTPAIDPASLPTSSNFNAIRGFASGGDAAITPEFILLFSVISLIFTVIFSSLTIGVINQGKELSGFKFIFPLVIVNMFIFFSARAVLGSVFSSLV